MGFCESLKGCLATSIFTFVEAIFTSSERAATPAHEPDNSGDQ